MTPMEAWRIISANLWELYKRRRADNPNYDGYTDADVEAEVVAFKALNIADAIHTVDTKVGNKQKGGEGNA